jgi:hypothetical protein
LGGVQAGEESHQQGEAGEGGEGEKQDCQIELIILACLWKVLNVGLLDVSGKIVEGRQRLDARRRTLDSLSSPSSSFLQVPL